MNYKDEIDNNILWIMICVMFMENHSLLEFIGCFFAGFLIYGANKAIDHFM